jgi:hypothetical protein
MENADVEVWVLSSRSASVAEVCIAMPNGEVFEATGEAKRKPGDKPDPEFGSQLAISRALRNLADQINPVEEEPQPAPELPAKPPVPYVTILNGFSRAELTQKLTQKLTQNQIAEDVDGFLNVPKKDHSRWVRDDKGRFADRKGK